MNVLILGSGGREHVLAKKMSQSKAISKLFIAPGNAGTAECGQNIAISATDFAAVAEICLSHQIDLILPGNEDPLVAGIVDFIAAHPQLNHIMVAGPSKAAAQLEGSKDFSKILMAKYQIPTAQFLTVTADNYEAGCAFLDQLSAPYVLKADGLAAGKGVLIIDDLAQAKSDLKDMLHGKFGQASAKVVIEEFLKGIELSAFVLADGEHYIMLPEAKDYKRIGVADTGLNTGGMGAVSPVPFADKAFMDKVEAEVVIPTLKGLQQEGIPYKGFLFIGLMNVDGQPKVIEYNCRMGDPETEVVIHRLNNDLLDLMVATCQGQLNKQTLSVNPQTAVTVFMVSGGYPEQFEKGYEITGLDKVKDSVVYHAGTTIKDNKVVTNGGRVIAVTSVGADISSALQHSMANAAIIQFENKYYRTDIGQDLL
ncbi:MAG: hypothetical protein RLZZ318_29 [Bacteroidota bacterium]